ncbi:hypothetical protein QQS21_008619 [Conoideocrella luteorostrata]|uniref:Uncharacterized protein n=1 Tax=Conoideocrella luteorostrata TaxID=1105319 RepID=A0AAJ0CMZ6_9HYPO|nr:hypothetical protein QQS21_008619 [Conoideocrella luteorostrata]
MLRPSQRPQTLQVSDFKHYLRFPMLLWYYKEINKAGSLGSDVDAFYLNFLAVIFTARDNFGVELESRPATYLDLSDRPDFTIRCVRYFKNGRTKKVILYENKREGESQPNIWTDALDQVVKYANLVREEDQSDDDTIYLTVNVGTYLRFYELPGKSSEPIDWAPAGGRYYELADDEEDVWKFWNQIRDVVKSP